MEVENREGRLKSIARSLRRNRGTVQESLNARKEAFRRFNSQAVRRRLDEVGFICDWAQEKRRCAAY